MEPYEICRTPPTTAKMAGIGDVLKRVADSGALGRQE